ncbi:MAG: hypothetical protein ACRC8S_18980 [Fimbriiglobus sp.]
MHKATKRLLVTIAGVLVVGYLLPMWPILTREPVGPPSNDLPQSVEGETFASGDFAGHTADSILERFGSPTHRWEGHYGAPRWDFQQKYPDANTAVYEQPTGSLYLSFCKDRGQLVCFRSHWLPTGWEF